eukprot:COSAG01_NODE_12217_length_1778_cov_1.442525_1_plen_93_part_00
MYNESAADDGEPGFKNGTGYWHGGLSVGYGGDHTGEKPTNTEVGPELGFGWALGDAYKGTGRQVLLIKTAWGGKTIGVSAARPAMTSDLLPF